MVNVLNVLIFYAPNIGKVEGHIALGLSVHPSFSPLVCLFKI